MATNSQKKAQAHMAARDTRPAAHAKYVRISSRKVKIVIDLIRGKNADDALAILKYTPKAAAPVVHKLLTSAIANAENNNSLSVADLVVKEATVGEGMTIKRIRPRARGSASPIHKRTSHIRIVLSDEIPITRRGDKKKKAAAKPAAKKASKKAAAETPAAEASAEA